MRLSKTGLEWGHKRDLVLGGVFGAGVLGLIWVALYGLPTIGSVNAAETQVSLGVATVLSLTTTPGSALNLPITPTATGVHTTRKLTANVATNNLTGFTLTMSSGENYDDPNNTGSTISGTNLANLAGNATNLLPPTTGTVDTPTTLGLNTWGFAVPKTQTNQAGLLPSNPSSIFDNTYSEVTNQASLTAKFATLPPLASPLTLKTTSSQSAGDNTDLYFGTMIDTSKPAGSYRGTIILSVIANWVEPEPQYMQSFTASDCAALGGGTPSHTTTDWVPYTTILTDNRDGQEYRVRKLPDGKCWMIDNMKLGNTGGDITLTAKNSNLVDGETFAIPPSAISITGSTPGEPNRLNNGRCDSGAASGDGNTLTCDGTSSQSVANYAFRAYVDPSDTYACYNNSTGFGGDVYDPKSLTKCGYHYNWYTATAGQGNYDTLADNASNANAVASSICPTGWHLPKAGDGNANTSNELAILSGAMIGNGPSTTSDSATIQNFQPVGPFSGSFSGFWHTSYQNVGYSGYYWTSSASPGMSNRNARTLFVGLSGVNPGGSEDYKTIGLAVRCVISEL